MIPFLLFGVTAGGDVVEDEQRATPGRKRQRDDDWDFTHLRRQWADRARYEAEQQAKQAPKPVAAPAAPRIDLRAEYSTQADEIMRQVDEARARARMYEQRIAELEAIEAARKTKKAKLAAQAKIAAAELDMIAAQEEEARALEMLEVAEIASVIDIAFVAAAALSMIANPMSRGM
jgi:hypothetical protein